MSLKVRPCVWLPLFSTALSSVAYVRRLLHQVGNCKCLSKPGKKGQFVQKAQCNTCHGSCSTIGGGSGSLTLTATFMDIAFGDGSNGVDVSFEALHARRDTK
jgi:hypothetical protein